MTGHSIGDAAHHPMPLKRAGEDSHGRHASVSALTVAAVGIVYGGIATSPLYALDQLFLRHGGVPLSSENVLGGISLVILTLTVIVAIKYACFVLRAQNDGEGGVFALYGLLHGYKHRGIMIFLWSLMLGAGLLFGDGIITPAISVLAAVEGLGVAAPALGGAVIPVTMLLLTALFAVQVKGTAGIGRIFGPVLIVWFVVLAILGVHQIAQHVEILRAFNPVLGLVFLGRVGLFQALLVLGSLVLVVTGAEAMYADLGHFGARPIRISWFTLVYPALLLNYLGQGAFLLSGAPIVGGKIFYSLVPASLLYPTILLATAATVIASQALISGAFSLASQATGLGLFPRLRVLHTHHAHAGQIYIPFINWALYAGCIVLVLTFGSSAALGAAYGLAVSGVMVITSAAMFPVSRLCWGWSTIATGLLWGSLTTINGSFFLASSLKLLEGGFVPAVHRRCGVSRHGDLAMGPQGNLCRLYQEGDDDHRGADRASSPQSLLHGTYGGADGSHTAAPPFGSHPGTAAIVVGPIRGAAAKLDFPPSHAPQGALHSRRSVRGDRVRQAEKHRQHHRRRAEFRLYGGTQCGACARRHGPREGD